MATWEFCMHYFQHCANSSWGKYGFDKLSFRIFCTAWLNSHALSAFCRKTSVNSFCLPMKNCTSASVLTIHFFLCSAMKMNLHVAKSCFALITHLLSIRVTPSWINVAEWKAQGLARNWCCLVVASLALNKFCSFDQSACSIESRCKVMLCFVVIR